MSSTASLIIDRSNAGGSGLPPRTPVSNTGSATKRELTPKDKENGILMRMLLPNQSHTTPIRTSIDSPKPLNSDEKLQAELDALATPTENDAKNRYKEATRLNNSETANNDIAFNIAILLAKNIVQVTGLENKVSDLHREKQYAEYVNSLLEAENTELAFSKTELLNQLTELDTSFQKLNEEHTSSLEELEDLSRRFNEKSTENEAFQTKDESFRRVAKIETLNTNKFKEQYEELNKKVKQDNAEYLEFGPKFLQIYALALSKEPHKIETLEQLKKNLEDSNIPGIQGLLEVAIKAAKSSHERRSSYTAAKNESQVIESRRHDQTMRNELLKIPKDILSPSRIRLGNLGKVDPIILRQNTSTEQGQLTVHSKSSSETVPAFQVKLIANELFEKVAPDGTARAAVIEDSEITAAYDEYVKKQSGTVSSGSNAAEEKGFTYDEIISAFRAIEKETLAALYRSPIQPAPGLEDESQEDYANGNLMGNTVTREDALHNHGSQLKSDVINVPVAMMDESGDKNSGFDFDEEVGSDDEEFEDSPMRKSDKRTSILQPLGSIPQVVVEHNVHSPEEEEEEEDESFSMFKDVPRTGSDVLSPIVDGKATGTSKEQDTKEAKLKKFQEKFNELSSAEDPRNNAKKKQDLMALKLAVNSAAKENNEFGIESSEVIELQKNIAELENKLNALSAKASSSSSTGGESKETFMSPVPKQFENGPNLKKGVHATPVPSSKQGPITTIIGEGFNTGLTPAEKKSDVGTFQEFSERAQNETLSETDKQNLLKDVIAAAERKELTEVQAQELYASIIPEGQNIDTYSPVRVIQPDLKVFEGLQERASNLESNEDIGLLYEEMDYAVENGQMTKEQSAELVLIIKSKEVAMASATATTVSIDKPQDEEKKQGSKFGRSSLGQPKRTSISGDAKVVATPEVVTYESLLEEANSFKKGDDITTFKTKVKTARSNNIIIGRQQAAISSILNKLNLDARATGKK
jgi:hypothetical protein